MKFVGKTFCNDDSFTQFLCTNSMFLMCGFNKDNLNTTIIPVIMAHTPAGASTKQFLHYAQLINSGIYFYIIRIHTVLKINFIFI